MNNIIFKYLLSEYLKTIFKVILIVYCFGIILNLFEEIEFFKNVEAPFFIPLILTSLYIPGMMIQLLPFVIFISSMIFIIKIRNNKDLLSMKIFGYSNFKIFFILATVSFILGWIVLFLINPLTSVMTKYYEQTKSNYSRDIDHLVTFNKNGLWIKENLTNGQRIISASKNENKNLENITIFNFDKNYELKEKIFSKTANIEKNEWSLYDVTYLKIVDGVSTIDKKAISKINSIYTYEKIINLFKNLETLSFIDLILNQQKLLNQGYNKIFLNQNFHSMLSMPFFLFIMTSLASILVMYSLKKSNNFKFIIIGLFSCVLIYYLKDLSIALGQTNRIPISLAAWVPVIVIGLFSSIGVLQINEK